MPNNRGDDRPENFAATLGHLTKSAYTMTLNGDLPAVLDTQLLRAIEAIENTYELMLNERAWECCAIENLPPKDLIALAEAKRRWVTSVEALRAYRRAPGAALESETKK
jgi:hypothetical protein